MVLLLVLDGEGFCLWLGWLGMGMGMNVKMDYYSS